MATSTSSPCGICCARPGATCSCLRSAARSIRHVILVEVRRRTRRWQVPLSFPSACVELDVELCSSDLSMGADVSERASRIFLTGAAGFLGAFHLAGFSADRRRDSLPGKASTDAEGRQAAQRASSGMDCGTALPFPDRVGAGRPGPNRHSASIRVGLETLAQRPTSSITAALVNLVLPYATCARAMSVGRQCSRLASRGKPKPLRRLERRRVSV